MGCAVSAAELLDEARGWLADCDLDVDDLTDDQVRRTVDAKFEGGWTAFVRGQS